MEDDTSRNSNSVDLERVHWMSSHDWNARERVPATGEYVTFADLAEAIDEFGPLEVCNDRVNIFFIRTDGRFEEDIVAIRQSGLNVRRVLVKKDEFEVAYGNYQECLNHLMSNNAVGAAVEYAHIKEIQDIMKIDLESLDYSRRYNRAELDVVATLQMMAIRDEYLEEDPEDAAFVNFLFDIGFTAGRTFSAVQNLTTLEESANKGFEYQRQYEKRGKNSGSDKRKSERLEQFLKEVERVFIENEALREHEDMLLRVAFDKAVPKGTYGTSDQRFWLRRRPGLKAVWGVSRPISSDYRAVSAA